MIKNEKSIISLKQLSKQAGYSYDYLLMMAQNGYLKAFKLEDDWLTTNEWFDDFKYFLAESIEKEIGNFDHKKFWITEQSRTRFGRIFSRRLFNYFIVSTLSIFLFIGVSFISLLAVTLVSFDRSEVGLVFIDTVEQVYSFPINSLANLQPLPDELITEKIHHLINNLISYSQS